MYKITEVHQPNTVSFDFMGFNSLSQILKSYVTSGILSRKKRYRIEIKEI